MAIVLVRSIENALLTDSYSYESEWELAGLHRASLRPLGESGCDLHNWSDSFTTQGLGAPQQVIRLIILPFAA